jgi:hypothetical protein
VVHALKSMTHPDSTPRERHTPEKVELCETDLTLVRLIRAVRKDETERNTCGIRDGAAERNMDIWHALRGLGVDPWDAREIISRSLRPEVRRAK